MKIIFITNQIPPSICGVGDHTFQLAKALIGRGHVVEMICRNSEQKELADLPKVKVHAVVENWDKAGFKTAFEVIKNTPHDWVFIQYVPNGFNPKGIPLSILPFLRQLRKANFKTLVFFHEIAVRWDKGLKNNVLSAAQRILAHLILSFSDKAVTSMAFYKRMFIGPFRSKLQLQAISSNVFIDSLSDEKAVEYKKTIRNGSNENSFWLGCFGGDSPDKGYAVLLEAVKRHPSVKLLFVGNGRNIKNYAAENGMEKQVVVTGNLASEQVNYYLRSTDVFAMVHADIRGGVGFKSGSLAAGFNANLPILAYKGAITETDKLIHGENCFLVETPNADAFDAAISQLKSDSKLRQKLSLGSQQFFQKHLNWSTIAQEYERWLTII